MSHAEEAATYSFVVPPKTDSPAPSPGSRRPATLSIPETAELLGVSEKIVRSAINQGHIETVRIGRLIRVLRAPLLKSLGLPEDYEI